jgi:hypothetical protein
VEHLKAVFHEALADPAEGLVRIEGGQVHIYEGRWEPHDLLRAMGTDAYEKEFRSWLASYREQLLDRGRELLAEFDQEERFNALKAVYRRDAVVPFVGAGMSQPSGYPGWPAFLHRLWAKLGHKKEDLDAMLARGEYEEAAQVLADALTPHVFSEHVENTFGQRRPLAGPVQLLPHLFAGAVVTTNFDEVLHECYENADRPFSETLLGTKAQEFQRVLATGRPFLTQLHGSARSAADRVLTKSEYDHAYADPKTIQRVVKALCSRTLLFMGCSLSVDRLLTCVKEHVGAEGHNAVARHYAFVGLPAGTDAATRQAKETELARGNIYPVWYVKGEDSWEIESLLHLLADGVVSW